MRDGNASAYWLIQNYTIRTNIGKLEKQVVQLITGHDNFRAYLARVGIESKMGK